MDPFFEVDYDDSYEPSYSDSELPPLEYFLNDQPNDGESLPTPAVNLPEPPRPIIYDDSVALFNTVSESKNAVREITGMDSHSLRSNNVPGLIVLPLKDLSLVRKDDRSNRPNPNFIVLPSGENFNVIHPDLAQMIDILYRKP